MQIGNKQIEQLVITSTDGEVLAVISDDEIIEKEGYSVIVDEQNTQSSDHEQKKYVKIPVTAIRFDDGYWDYKWRNEPIQDGWIKEVENILNGYTITISLP